MLKQAGCNAAYLCRPQLSSCALLAGPSQSGLLQSSTTVATPFSAIRTLATQTPADSQGSSNSSTKLWAGIAAALGLGYGIGSVLSGNSDSAMPKSAVALADRPQHGKINAISKEITSAVEKAPPAAISGMTKGATKVDAGRVHSGEEPPHHGGAGPTTGPSSAEVDHNWPTVWGPHAGMPHMTKDAKKAALKHNLADLPVVPAPKATAPAMPPPVNRDHPVHMILDITTSTLTANVSPTHKYTWWTFDGTVPGPIVRCRVGDVLEVRYANKDADGIGHNIDFHAVTGPGGGAGVTYAEAGEVKTALFKMLDPGLFIYHCAAAPLPTHVANGMYGLVLVEPEEGLPPVDKEFFVLQSEVYAQESETPGLLDHNYFDGLSEKPMYVVFNGAEGSLTEKPLMVDQDDRVRIFFGNAGPNLVSALHLIGITFEKVYREGDLVSPPARSVQTTLVPPGGSAVVEFTAHVPGNYSLVDHALFRVDKGAVGFLKVKPKGNDRRADIFDSVDPPSPCPGCKLHN